MTVESITFYIQKNKNEEVSKYFLEKEIDKKLSVVNKQNAGLRTKQKIKSKELITRNEFNELIDFLKQNNAEMLNVTMYLNTEGNIFLMNMLDNYYKEHKSIDIVIDTIQMYKIFTHTDLDKNISDFIKNFERNIPLMENITENSSKTFYRTNITELRSPKGYDVAWNFIKEIAEKAYFIK